VNKANNPYMDDNYVHYNKFGITNALELRWAEYESAANRSREILEGNAPSSRPGSYDFKHLKSIHHHLFQDVYEWAGETRTIGFSKRMDGKNTVSVFAHPDTFVEKMRALEKKTNAFVLAKGLTFAQKINALVDIFVDANHIHPFPEGNGRALQVFMRQLAREQGVVLDYRKTHTKEWNFASAISGVYGEGYVDEKGEKRLKQHPRDQELITRIFSNMARPERVLERAAGIVDRFVKRIGLADFSNRHAYKQALVPSTALAWSAEQERRAADLAAIKHASAGAQLTFAELGANAIKKKGGAAKQVDWHGVEDAAIVKACRDDHQSAEDVYQAIAEASPGAITGPQRAALRERVNAVAHSLDARVNAVAQSLDAHENAMARSWCAGTPAAVPKLRQRSGTNRWDFHQEL